MRGIIELCFVDAEGAADHTEDVNGIVRKLMEMDDKLSRVLEILEREHGR